MSAPDTGPLRAAIAALLVDGADPADVLATCWAALGSRIQLSEGAEIELSFASPNLACLLRGEPPRAAEAVRALARSEVAFYYALAVAYWMRLAGETELFERLTALQVEWGWKELQVRAPDVWSRHAVLDERQTEVCDGPYEQQRALRWLVELSNAAPRLLGALARARRT